MNKLSPIETITILKEIILLELMHLTKNDAKVLQDFVHGVVPNAPPPQTNPENPHRV